MRRVAPAIMNDRQLTVMTTLSSARITPALERVLQALARQSNMAVTDIAAQAFVGVSTLACGGYIRTLRARGLIHVSGWRKVNGRFSTPLYSVGDKPDVERPRIDETNRSAPGMDRIVDVLREFGGLTQREIAVRSGLSPNTVKNSGYLDALLAQGRIHIAQWRRSRNGPMSPVYVAGPGRSVPKSAVLSKDERNRRHRLRRCACADGAELKTQLAGLTGRARDVC